MKNVGRRTHVALSARVQPVVYPAREVPARAIIARPGHLRSRGEPLPQSLSRAEKGPGGSRSGPSPGADIPVLDDQKTGLCRPVCCCATDGDTVSPLVVPAIIAVAVTAVVAIIAVIVAIIVIQRHMPAQLRVVVMQPCGRCVIG
jgi:hypothetical protein